MSGYAIRDDMTAWRSVESASDIMAGEFFSRDPIHLSKSSLSTHDIECARLIAYADPITGSDRYFAEAARLTAMSAPTEDIAAATAAGIARAAEIAAMFPWPDDGDTA